MMKQIEYTTDPQAFASMIGAIGEVSYDDIWFNECTDSEGIGYPSVSHVRGYNTDFRYLRKDKTGNTLNINTQIAINQLDKDRQNVFISSLKNFGWSDVCGHNPTANPTGLNVKHLSFHTDHLHCQGYAKTIITLKK